MQIDEINEGLSSGIADEVGPILTELSVRTNQHATKVTTLGDAL